MSSTVHDLVARIRSHRAYHHPIFEHWAKTPPESQVVGALFHQIRCFCDATRPGGKFPQALAMHALSAESVLFQEIIESEENHGPELATMAGHIVNQAAGWAVFADIYNQELVEQGLKEFSDQILHTLPGYDPKTGLLAQTRRARAVFDSRQQVDKESTMRNLGVALALEMISNRHLIPGEKTALVDAGTYRVSLDDAEMHYLLEHWGEIGAEQQHEKNAVAAVESVLDAQTEALIVSGLDEFLDALTALWDVLDAALLISGQPRTDLVTA
ncbi:MAG TPA: hypothetical protein VFC19_43085 [Candidatus Limnocylindrales bacterium]|nr:hypothetical protein [Candidatus Limnocylindrales bacterium]